MKPISQRKKKIPLPKTDSWGKVEGFVIMTEDLPPHHLRRSELSALHGIPEKDIFVDRGNGVELYKTSTGGWAFKPGW